MTAIEYPNREHANADKAARRRALKALNDIIDDAEALRRRINEGRPVEGASGCRIAFKATELTVNLTFLETLRDVREWHAVDLADAATRVLAAPEEEDCEVIAYLACGDQLDGEWEVGRELAASLPPGSVVKCPRHGATEIVSAADYMDRATNR